MSTINPYEAPQASLQKLDDNNVFDETSPFSAAGRFGRASYITYAVGSYFVLMLVMAVVTATRPLLNGAAPVVIGGIAMISYITFFALAVIFIIRRLHDLNWSGWLAVLTILPLVNLVIAIPCLFFKGTNGVNNYGPPPKPNKTHVRLAVVFGVLMAVALIGVITAVTIPAYQQYVHRAQQINR